MRRFYLSPLAGLGLRLDPFRPAVAAALSRWGGCDGRKNATQITGEMLVTSDVTEAQHAAALLLAGVVEVGNGKLAPPDTLNRRNETLKAELLKIGAL